MKPILFDSKATAFNTNGIGRLKDCISCVVTEERNGIYECELTYPVTGQHYSDIEISRIVVVKVSWSGNLQAFRIFRISRPINGQVTISCRHISYQLSYIPFRAFSASSLKGALAGFKSNALEPCPFTLTSDFDNSSSYAIPLPASIKSYLAGREGSIIDVYGNGAEWEWDNYNCILHKNRGADRGVILRYGKNIKDLKQEINIENTITGILPYWNSENSRVILSKPIEAATAANFPFPRTVVMDFSDKFDNAPTVAQLTNITNQYISQNKIGIPSVSMDVSFIDLAGTVEYKHLAPTDIRLCDTVTVDFVKLGIQTKAKVVKIEYDVLAERYNNIEIGDGRTTFSATVEEQAQQISARPTMSQMRDDIDRATGVLNSGLRGHVIINRNQEGWANEILFLDNENIAQAKNVLRINNNGIGFSSTGYNGPYYQSWTIDGHFALGGVNNAYGDFEILDGSGKKLGEWDKDGLKLYDSSQRMLLAINNTGLYLYNASKKVLAQLTANGLNIYNGYIKLGNKFEVKQDGSMTATGAKFSGSITASTIDIGKNFHVNAKGELSATNAKFSGDIEGSKITGSRIESKGGQFVASEEDVYIGGFHTFSTDAGQYLATDGEEMGIGDNEEYQFWTGWSGHDPDINDPGDIMDEYGTVITRDTMYAQDMYLHHDVFWGQSSGRWWTIGETIEDIYDEIDSLKRQIKNSGGDEE